jgi:hypothetical protein
MHPLLLVAAAPAVLALTLCTPVGPESSLAPEGGAAQGPTSEPTDCPGPLCLTLTAPRRELRLAEPLTLVATRVNRSEQTQEVLDPLAPEHGALTLRARLEGHPEARVYAPVVRRDSRGWRPRSLAPDESASEAFVVALGQEGWFLSEPGRHRLWAEYSPPKGDLVRSNDVVIEVRPPETARERQAVERFLVPESSLFFQMKGGEHLEQGTRDLEEISESYADTYVAAYADLALGIHQSQSAFDPATKTFREPDCRGAAEHLRRAVPAIGDPLSAAQGTAALVGCLSRLGRHEEAAAATRAFYEAHPEARDLPGIPDTLERALQEK